jgi:uncharacterized protein
MMHKGKGLHMLSFILVIIGGLNWGLVGLLQWNLVELILGFSPLLVKVVYILVGLAAVYLGATHMKDCRQCNPGGDHSHSNSPNQNPAA